MGDDRVMGDDSELLRAIRESPDDLELRLVLGDMLASRGDPRGELVSVQCTLAAIADDDPRRIPLRRREHAILQALGEPPAGEYRRGMIERVSMRAQVMGQVLDRLVDEPIIELDVFEANDEAIAELSNHPVLAHLRTLELAGYYFTPERAVDLLAKTPALRTFEITHTGPHDLSAALAASPHLLQLERLGVSEKLQADPLVALCKRELPALVALKLSDEAYLPELGAIISEHLQLPALQSLTLQGYGLDDRQVATLVRRPKLREVALRHHRLFVDTQVIDALAELPALAKLDLTGSSFIQTAVEGLAAHRWPALSTLLVASDFEKQGRTSATLARAQLPALTSLTLPRDLDVVDIEALATADWPLRELSIRLNRLPDGVPEALVRAPWASTLRSLDVSTISQSSRQSTMWIDAIAAAELPALEDLHVGTISDRQRALLAAKCPNLVRVLPLLY